MSDYVEAKSNGQERRSLHELVIHAASEDGEGIVVVSKTFEAEHHAPEAAAFRLDEGHELLDYVSQCLQINPYTGEMFAGPAYGHALIGEEQGEESPAAESESGEEETYQ
jgi:hypothetical protein